jgi:hypothetical protein
MYACVLLETGLPEDPHPYGTSGNSAKFPAFPNQIIPIPFDFVSKI